MPNIHGLLTASNATLKDLVQYAYALPEYRVFGASGWMIRDRFDVEARAPSRLQYSFGEIQSMMQSLLKERFHLVVSRESREMPLFALVVAKGGIKMTESKDSDCYQIGPTSTIADQGTKLACGSVNQVGRGHVTGKKVLISTFATVSSYALGRPVVDDTGLDMRLFDIHLHWAPRTPDPFSAQGAQPNTAGPVAPLPDQAEPDLFTAFEEQLGLKAESRRGPVDVVVIQHADPPGDN